MDAFEFVDHRGKAVVPKFGYLVNQGFGIAPKVVLPGFGEVVSGPGFKGRRFGEVVAGKGFAGFGDLKSTCVSACNTTASIAHAGGDLIGQKDNIDKAQAACLTACGVVGSVASLIPGQSSNTTAEASDVTRNDAGRHDQQDAAAAAGEASYNDAINTGSSPAAASAAATAASASSQRGETPIQSLLLGRAAASAVDSGSSSSLQRVVPNYNTGPGPWAGAQPGIAAPPPASDNTMLYIGGAALALAVVAFAMKKKG